MSTSQAPPEETPFPSSPSSAASNDPPSSGGISPEEIQRRRAALIAKLGNLFVGEPRTDAVLRVLEVGCGGGVAGEILYNYLRERWGGVAATFFAADLDPGNVRVADRRFRRGGCERAHALVGDFFSLPIPDGTIDYLAAFNVFYWVDKESFLREAARVLAPGGRMLIYDRLPDSAENKVPSLTLLLDHDRLRGFLQPRSA